MPVQNVTFRYRDAANYKFYFDAVVHTPIPLAVGDELSYTLLGISEEQFFADIVNYPQDDEDDHNILDVHALDDEEFDSYIDTLHYTHDSNEYYSLAHLNRRRP